MALSLEHAILGLLDQRPRSGYEVKRRCFDEALAPFWGADQAQIYRTLERLRDARLVSATRRRQSGRPDRRIFDITEAGRDELARWLSTPALPPSCRDPLMLQLYFGASLPDHALLTVLEARRDAHQSRLDELRASVALVSEADAADDRAVALRRAALEGAIVRERAAIDWLDDCAEAVREGALPGSEVPGIGQRHLFGT